MSSHRNTDKISIFIPTRNGANYILDAIQSILCLDDSNFELTVSINQSADQTLELVRQIKDPRFQYILTPKSFSLAEHYEWCLNHATGEWVTFMGDDDGVMPHFFIEVRRLLEKYPSIEAFSFRRALFFWPGAECTSGGVVLDARFARIDTKVCSQRQLLFSLIGASEYYDLPQLYTNNLIKRSLAKRIQSHSENKNFYQHTMADVYSGAAIANETRHFVRSELPIFWTASSPKSLGFSAQSIEDERGLIRDKFISHEIIGTESVPATRSSVFYVLSSLWHVPNMKKVWKNPIVVLASIRAGKNQIKFKAAEDGWLPPNIVLQSFVRHLNPKNRYLALAIVLQKFVIATSNFSRFVSKLRRRYICREIIWSTSLRGSYTSINKINTDLLRRAIYERTS